MRVTTPLPSGTQHHLHHGDQEAVIAEVGASLRLYRSGGHDVVRPYDEDVLTPAFSGALLAPWPNRLADGRYGFDGAVYQVPVTEVDRMTALHGLVGQQRFTPAGPRTDDATVTLQHDLVPTGGYPWPLLITVTFTLSDEGLTSTVTALNQGASTAPYGAGVHPWLSTAGAAVDDCTLSVGAARHVTVDNRLLPTGTEAVANQFDLREPRRLAGVVLDDAWVGVLRDGDERSWATLARPDGTTVAMWGDAATTAWQVCTGDLVAGIGRTAVAVEPMTCVADAFRTGDDLVRLEPGQEHVMRWGLQLR